MSKAALKAINEAVKQQKFDDVIKKSRELVQNDPKSYQGYAAPRYTTLALHANTDLA